MLHPRILVYEGDGSLARLLRPLAGEQRWSLREPRRPQACLALLRRPHPTVLVVKLGRDVACELGLVERVHWLHPHTASVVVGDVEDPALDGLAWDVGAACVWTPPRPRDQLPAIVSALMEAAVCRLGAWHDAQAAVVKSGGRPPVAEDEASLP